MRAVVLFRILLGPFLRRLFESRPSVLVLVRDGVFNGIVPANVAPVSLELFSVKRRAAILLLTGSVPATNRRPSPAQLVSCSWASKCRFGVSPDTCYPCRRSKRSDGRFSSGTITRAV